MRGRTNIVQRLRPIINGDEKKFVVAPGENIETGDFVSYEIITSIKTLLSESAEVLDFKEVSENYYVMLIKKSSGNFLYLAKYENSEISLLDYWVEKVYCFCLFNDCIICHVENEPYVLSLEIIDDKLVKKSEAINGKVTVYPSYCFVEQNVLVLLRGSGSNLYVTFYSIDGELNITFEQSEKISLGGYASTSDAKNFVNIGNEVYFTYASKASSSGTGSYYFMKLTLDFVNFTSSKEVLLSSLFSNGTYGGMTVGKPKIINDTYYVLFYYTGSTSLSSCYPRCMVINIKTNSKTNYTLSTLGFSFKTPETNSQLLFLTSNVIDDNKFLIIIQNQFCILEVGIISGELLKSSDILIQESGAEYRDNMAVIPKNSILLFLYPMSGYGVVSVKLDSNYDYTALYEYTNRTQVRKYVKNSKSIGFAKHSATEGQDITIYVPKEQ